MLPHMELRKGVGIDEVGQLSRGPAMKGCIILVKKPEFQPEGSGGRLDEGGTGTLSLGVPRSDVCSLDLETPF